MQVSHEDKKMVSKTYEMFLGETFFIKGLSVCVCNQIFFCSLLRKKSTSKNFAFSVTTFLQFDFCRCLVKRYCNHFKR